MRSRSGTPARRLGAEEAIIVYRRTREQMPAHEEEAVEAEREGVHMNWLRTIKAFEGETLQVEVMELDETALPAAHRSLRDARGRQRDPCARAGDRHGVPSLDAGRRVRARWDGQGLELVDD